VFLLISVAELKQQYVSSYKQEKNKPGLFIDTDSKDELWRVIRKLSDDSAMLVVLALDKNREMTSRELRDETKLPGSNLNHALTDLKSMKVIWQDKESKKYQLTKYGEIILGALDELLLNISRYSIKK
jgi:predicted transcriptional regulator